MAGVAMDPQRALPLFHDLVHLLPAQVLGQYLQVGRSRIGARRRTTGALGRPLWGLSSRPNGKQSYGQKANRGGQDE
jgi:hypothetical protein